MYNSSAYIEKFYTEALAALQSLSITEYEFIIVDDGSVDDSLSEAIRLVELDKNVLVFELSRNFGHHNAIMTGLAESTGDLVFFVDSDLEESPDLLIEFYEKLKREGADVVYGQQENRTGSHFDRISGYIFYKVFNILSDVKIPKNILNVRLMTKQYVDSLLLYREKSLFLAGLWASTGFNQFPHPVVRTPRNMTTYSLKKRIALMVSGVASFSNRPLIIVFYVGMIISILSFGSVLYLFYLHYAGVDVPGYISTIASTWFLGGILLLCQGVMAIYLSKVFEEVKNRPTSITKKIHKGTLDGGTKTQI